MALRCVCLCGGLVTVVRMVGSAYRVGMADAKPAITGPAGGGFGPLRWLPETESTNSLLVAEAAAGARHGAVVVADHQTAGRGRLGREWKSEPGSSLAVSVLLRPDAASFPLPLVGVAVANAALEACRGLGADVYLKWPNDLVSGPGAVLKLGGILSEVVPHPSLAAVAGLGLNLKDPLPQEVQSSATNIQRLTGSVPDAATLVSAYLGALDSHYTALATAGGTASELGLYRERCVTLGQLVRVELPGGSVQGVASGVTERGELLVKSIGEELTVVAVGDVVHLRALRAG